VDYTSVQSHQGGNPAGVLVREVVPNSPADRARMQPDMIIRSVNGRPVRTPAEFYQEMDRAGGAAEVEYLSAEGNPERVTLEQR
jgi:S1-C subfamily serine protease